MKTIREEIGEEEWKSWPTAAQMAILKLESELTTTFAITNSIFQLIEVVANNPQEEKPT